MEREKVESIPHIEFIKLKLIDEYIELYSEVLFRLKYKADEIIDFVKALDEHQNNLFNPNNKIYFRRTDEIINRAGDTVKCIISQHIDENKLIWIYVNSYLRLTVRVQTILDSMLKHGGQTLQLDCFNKYRFYGSLSDYVRTNDKGVRVGLVLTKSISSLTSMSFLLDKESNVTEEMIEGKSFVSFRLKKYYKSSNEIFIEDICRPQQKGWNVIHNCNVLIRHNGCVYKETLEEIKRLPELNMINAELKHFYPDLIWCINNLSKNKDDLFLYIKALRANNPYYYKPGQLDDIFCNTEEKVNAEQSRVVLHQLVESRYTLHKILWIYLNSYLRIHIPIHDVFEEYYENSCQKNSDIHYMSSKVEEIEFSAVIHDIRDNMLSLSLEQIDCNGGVFLRLENTDYTERDFKKNQQIKVILIEYHQSERILYAELCE